MKQKIISYDAKTKKTTVKEEDWTPPEDVPQVFKFEADYIAALKQELAK